MIAHISEWMPNRSKVTEYSRSARRALSRKPEKKCVDLAHLGRVKAFREENLIWISGDRVPHPVTLGLIHWRTQFWIEYQDLRFNVIQAARPVWMTT